jgi:hypothetical protein
MSDLDSAHSGDDPQSAAALVIGLVGLILALAIIIFVVVLFQDVQNMEDAQKTYAAKPQELADLQFQQLARINDRHVVDPNYGLIAIPIDQAIDLYVGGVRPASAPTTASAPSTVPAEPKTRGGSP